MSTTGVCVTIVLAIAAFAGNWWWTEKSRHQFIRRVADREKAPEVLVKHSNVFAKPEIIQVTPNIYCAVGYGLANSIMLEGEDGIVVVDVMESYQAAQAVFKAFRLITRKPVKAIIYTHNHADHTYGAKAFIEDPANPPEIWAHQLMLQELQRWFFATPILVARAMRQFGVYTPDHINSGIGIRLKFDRNDNQLALVFPNKLFIGQERDITIAGLNIKLVHIPGESADQIGVWIPDQKVFLSADDVYKAFPNLYAIRGTPSRNLLDWAASLDRIIDFAPEHLVPSHTRPISGADAIADLLTCYRDAIQFVHDQTVRLMNKGYHPEEIAHLIKLPAHLANHPYLLEFYGTVEWSSKGVFNSYLGWFNGDPADLAPFTPDEMAEHIVHMGGGVDNMILKARGALHNNEYRWALVLSSYILRIDSNFQEAKDIKAACLMALGNQQISANGRNYYHTSALETLGQVDVRPGPQSVAAFINNAPLRTVFDALRVHFDAEACLKVNITIAWEFSEPSSHVSMKIRNGVVIIRDRPAKTHNMLVTVVESVWRELLVNRFTKAASMSKDKFRVEGELSGLKKVMKCFDMNER